MRVRERESSAWLAEAVTCAPIPAAGATALIIASRRGHESVGMKQSPQTHDLRDNVGDVTSDLSRKGTRACFARSHIVAGHRRHLNERD